MTAIYDVPGPRARRRILVASVVAGVVLAALIALALKRFADHDLFAAEIWEPFSQWAVIKFLLLGLWMTLRVAAVAMVLSCTIGALLAFGRLSRSWLLRFPAFLYVQFFRATPLLVLILFSALALPKYGLRFQLPVFLVIGLTAYNSAVIAEIVRAGVLSLDRGQTEAALSVGLTDRQAMWLVVLPQAVRRMLPALVTQLVTILKDTSLGSVIAVEELLRRTQITGQFFPGTLLPAAIIAAAMYIAVCFSMSQLARRLEHRQQRRLGGAPPKIAANEELAVLQATARPGKD